MNGWSHFPWVTNIIICINESDCREREGYMVNLEKAAIIIKKKKIPLQAAQDNAVDRGLWQ